MPSVSPKPKAGQASRVVRRNQAPGSSVLKVVEVGPPVV
jgi:hypothetical protein